MTPDTATTITSPTPDRGPARRKRWIFRGVAVGLGCMAALTIAEVGLRLHVASRGWTPNCYVTGLAFFVPDGGGGSTLRPGLRLRSSAYDVRVNQLGFRGPDIQVSAAAGTRRVAVLGGSSVFGYLVPEGLDSCRVLELLLRSDGHKIEVINAGVPGFTMDQCRRRYITQVAALRPDAVIVYLGWNDIATLISSGRMQPIASTPPPWWQRMAIHSVTYGFLRYRLFPPATPQFAPPAKAIKTVRPEGIASLDQRFDQLITAILDTGAEVLISTQVMAACPNGNQLDRYLGNTREQIELNRRLGGVLTDRVRQAAKRHDVTLIEINDCVQCDDEVLGDAIHLTRLGHQAVAQCWRNALSPWLAAGSEKNLSVQP